MRSPTPWGRVLLLGLSILAVSGVGRSHPSAAGSDAVERALVEHIDAHREEALALLERVVEINSGTMNFDGVRRVGEIFAAEYEALGFAVRWIDGAAFERAGHLVAEWPGGGRGEGRPHLLLIGHLDTVFEIDSPFQSF